MERKIIGSIYTGVSDDFQRGLFPIFRCVKAENHDLGVVEMEVKQIGNLWGNDTDFENKTSGRVYGNLSPCIRSEREGFKTIVAMRGRNPDNPSDRTVGSPTEQRLEPNAQGICNTITTVQKYNMVLEKTICAVDEQNMNLRHETFGTLTTDGSSPKHNNRVMETVRIKQATKEGYIECEIGGVADLSCPDSTTRRGRVQEGGNICPTLAAAETGVCKIESQYRIRKLTPKECWRLMDFTDDDFKKASKVNSNTQLYKQAGNSIVVNVLVAILGQMLPGKEDVYKTRCSQWQNNDL